MRLVFFPVLIPLSMNFTGPVNPPSFQTNQGPPQWDQTSYVDNQQMAMPQEPCNQNTQPQNGTVLSLNVR